MRRIAISLIVLGVLVCSTLATGSARTAKAEVWKLDPVHCAAMFRVHHAGAGQFWGRFNDVSGTVMWPRDDSVAPIFDVVVKARSIDTGTAKLDRHLQSPDFFNSIEFDTLAFKSTSAERIGERMWTVKGNMTMLGQTKPIEAVVEVTGVVGNPVVAKAGWEAIFSIDRSDFGMTWGVDNGALGDEVKLIIALEGDTGPGA